MNGLPAGMNWEFLIGRTLQQVCFGQYQIQLRFDGEVWMDVEGAVTVDGAAAGAHILTKLLGAVITSVDAEGRGDLVVSIGGHGLVLYDSNAHYESYTIGAPGLHIVV